MRRYQDSLLRGCVRVAVVHVRLARPPRRFETCHDTRVDFSLHAGYEAPSPSTGFSVSSAGTLPSPGETTKLAGPNVV